MPSTKTASASQRSQQLSRRSFLQRLSVVGAAATAGITFASVFDVKPVHAEDDNSIANTLNIAVTAEAFACTHYFRALNNLDLFSEIQIDYLREGLYAELAHYQYLMENGAVPLAKEFYFPLGTFDSAEEFGAITATAETIFVSAYLAAARQFVDENQPTLAQVAAQVAVVEGQHLALMRIFDRALSSTTVFVEPIFTLVKDAVPLLGSVLDGATGSLGKMERNALPMPSVAEIRKLLG